MPLVFTSFKEMVARLLKSKPDFASHGLSWKQLKVQYILYLAKAESLFVANISKPVNYMQFVETCILKYS